MTGKRLTSITFEGREEVFASYLILKRMDKLLLAILARIEKEKIVKEEENIKRKADLFLTEFLKIGKSELANPVIDTIKYSFTESLVYTFFFREELEKMEYSSIQKTLSSYGSDNIVIGLNQDWKGRYIFYRNDPSFLKVVKGLNAEKIDIVLDKMDEANLYISVKDFVHYIGKMEDSESVGSNQKLIELLAFVMKKGVLELYTIHL